MDDIIITESDDNEINVLVRTLNKMFALKDLGPLHFFLGVEVTGLSNGLLLSQQKYIKKLLSKAKIRC